MKKRTWHYIQNPGAYQISCDLCGGTHIDWSEYAGMIWCYDCQKDTEGTPGIFDGPINIELCAMLGISLDRIDLTTGKRLKLKMSNGKIGWE